MGKIFKLKPVYKNYLWGGSSLKEKLHKDVNIFPCAESWELSTHNDGLSYVDDEDYKDMTLKDVLKLHPEYLGTHANENGELSILIKFIDAKNDLSIQVHPDDEFALQNENELGKTEVWYVLDSNNGKIAYGFKENVSKELIRERIKDNTICNYLNFIPVKKDDFYIVKPGTVHAICAGTLLVEIQENSNLTYRLYDYDRVDCKGNKRDLHIDKALKVINTNKTEVLKPRDIEYECKYFKIDRITGNSIIEIDNTKYAVLICTDGKCEIKSDKNILKCEAGDTIFISSNTKVEIVGNETILKVEV